MKKKICTLAILLLLQQSVSNYGSDKPSLTTIKETNKNDDCQHQIPLDQNSENGDNLKTPTQDTCNDYHDLNKNREAYGTFPSSKTPSAKNCCTIL